MRRLAELDLAKERMEAVCQALEQVEKLSKLSQEVEGVFASNDYGKARSTRHTTAWEANEKSHRFRVCRLRSGSSRCNMA